MLTDRGLSAYGQHLALALLPLTTQTYHSVLTFSVSQFSRADQSTHRSTIKHKRRSCLRRSRDYNPVRLLSHSLLEWLIPYLKRDRTTIQCHDKCAEWFRECIRFNGLVPLIGKPDIKNGISCRKYRIRIGRRVNCHDTVVWEVPVEAVVVGSEPLDRKTLWLLAYTT